MAQERNLWTAQPFKLQDANSLSELLQHCSGLAEKGRVQTLTSSTGTTRWPVLGDHHKELTSNEISRGWGTPYLLQSCYNLGGRRWHEHLLLQQSSTIKTCAMHGGPGHAPEAQGHSSSPYGCSSVLGAWYILPAFKIFQNLEITQDIGSGHSMEQEGCLRC